jgi:hypothetical protein
MSWNRQTKIHEPALACAGIWPGFFSVEKEFVENEK